MKNNRIYLVAATLLLIGLACSTFTGSNTFNSPNNIGDSEIQTPKPTNTPSTSEPDEPGEEFLIEGMPPVSYEAILEHGVETGRWTEEEGYLLLMKYFVGDISTDELPGATEVVARTATGVIRELQDILENQEFSPEIQIELEILLRRMLPPQDILDQISERKGSFRPNTIGSEQPLKPQQNQDVCLDLSGNGYEGEAENLAVCYFYRELVFENSTFRIYYPYQWEGDENAELLLNATFDALGNAANTYSSFQALRFSDINLIFPIEDDGNAYGVQFYFDEDEQACPIVMYPLSYETQSLAKHKQVVAHEMFHCIQDYSFQNTKPYSNHSWWMEGSADYFSNLVYPQTNLEWEFLDSFDTSSANTPLFDMKYENFVFFQFMGNKYSPEGLIDILHNISAAGDIPTQEIALSQAPNFDQNFNHFVVEYLSTGVPDSGGGTIRVSNFTITGTKAVDKVGNVEITVQPFVAMRYFVDYKQEKRFLQKPLNSEGTQFSSVKYDLRQDINAWSDLSPEIRSECKKDIRYVFVPTTAGDGYSRYDFQVTLAEKAECDPCLLGVWAVDNESFEDFILRISKDAGPVEGGGEFTIKVDGFNYLEFQENATIVTRRDAFAITTGISTYDATFTTTIDSQGGGTYSADGEKIQVFQLTDFVNSIYATLDGYPIAVSQTPSTGTYSFFGVSASGPGFDPNSGPEEAGGTYVCEEETLVVTQPDYGDILFNRVEKIMPTSVPTPAAGNVDNP